MAKTVIDRAGNTRFESKPKKGFGDKTKLTLWVGATILSGGIAGIGLGKEIQRQKDAADLAEAIQAGQAEVKKPATKKATKPVAKKKAQTKKPATTEKKTR